MQESGFKSHLIYNKKEFIETLMMENFTEEEAKCYATLAHQIISKRTLNPLELTLEEENRNKRNVENWIKNRDPNYTPL